MLRPWHRGCAPFVEYQSCEGSIPYFRHQGGAFALRVAYTHASLCKNLDPRLLAAGKTKYSPFESYQAHNHRQEDIMINSPLSTI